MSKPVDSKAKFNMKVACDAVEVIQDSLEKGSCEAEIYARFSVCAEAKSLLDTMSYRLRRNIDDANRTRLLEALEILSEFIRNTKDPGGAAEETWVVETLVVQMLNSFDSYMAYEAKYYQNPLNLMGFVSFFTEAAAVISGFIARGYITVACSSDKKTDKEWNNRPFNPTVDVLPGHGVYTNEWTMSDISRLAEDARKKQCADDKKKRD
jgi:hypothetical protein